MVVQPRTLVGSVPDPIQVVTLLKLKHPNRQEHGETDWWKALGETYLRRFASGVRRFFPSGTTIRCMTDAPELMPVGVEPWLLPADAPGWWSKNFMYHPEVSPDGQVSWYNDLDNVFGGPVDEIFRLDPFPAFMTDDRVYPRMPNGSSILFRGDELRYILRDYLESTDHWHRFYSTWPKASDQAYVADRLRFKGFPIPFLQDHLPNGWMLNARCELEQGHDWSNCRLVYGSWKPKPHESSHPYYARYWVDEAQTAEIHPS